jgi:putative transposase
MPKRPPRSSAEFRAEAIRLVRSSGKSKTAIAQELGVSLEALRAWLRQAELDAGERHDGLSSEELAEVRRLRRAVKILREERELLVQAAAFVARETHSLPYPGTSLSSKRRPPIPSRACAVCSVSPRAARSAWRRRVPSRRADANTRLQEHIVRIHSASRATYGAPRIHAELRAQGERCSRKRVARLRRLAGVAGGHRRRFRTTRRDPARPSAPDLLQRALVATAPNQVWVADRT